MTVAHCPNSPSLLRRIAAMLYDGLLIVALLFVVDAIAVGIVAWWTGDAGALPNRTLVQALAVLSTCGFFCVFWLKNGQTLGMQAWRIKLVNFQGQKPSLLQAVVRCVGAALSLACVGLGYLWCLVDRRKRYWHDYLSRTELVLLPERKASKSP